MGASHSFSAWALFLPHQGQQMPLGFPGWLEQVQRRPICGLPVRRAVCSALLVVCALLCDGPPEEPAGPAGPLRGLPLQRLPQVPLRVGTTDRAGYKVICELGGESPGLPGESPILVRHSFLVMGTRFLHISGKD